MKAVSDVIINKIIRRLLSAINEPTETHTVKSRDELNSILSASLDGMQAGSTRRVYVKDPNAVLGVGTKDYTITVYKRDSGSVPIPDRRIDMATMLVDGWYGFSTFSGSSIDSKEWQFTDPKRILDSGNIGDYVTEKGTTDGWTWEKWNSGKFEAWRSMGVRSAEATQDTSATARLTYKHQSSFDLPFELSGLPHVFVNMQNCDTLYAGVIPGVLTQNLTFFSPMPAPLSTTVDIHVIGKWK